MAQRASTEYGVKLGIDTTDGVKSVGNLSKGVDSFGKILKRTTAVLVAFKISNATIRGFGRLTKALVQSNAMFERFEVQLKVFTGSAAIASREMDRLAFESTLLAGGIEDLIKASTALSTFGMDSQKWLRLVADTAQATGRAVDDVAIAFGRIMSGDQRTKQFLTTRRGDLLEFERVLALTGRRAEALEAAFRKFEGVSAEMEGTFSRLAENLGDVLFIAAKMTGEPLFDLSKSVLKSFVDWLRDQVFEEGGKELKQNTIFHSIANSMQTLVSVTERAISVFGIFEQAFTAVPNALRTMGGADPIGPTTLGHDIFKGILQARLSAMPGGLSPEQEIAMRESIIQSSTWAIRSGDFKAGRLLGQKQIDEVLTGMHGGTPRQGTSGELRAQANFDRGVQAWDKYAEKVKRARMELQFMTQGWDKFQNRGGFLHINRERLRGGQEQPFGLDFSDEWDEQFEEIQEDFERIIERDVEAIDDRFDRNKTLNDLLYDMEVDTMKKIRDAEEDFVEERHELNLERISDMSSMYDRFIGDIDFFGKGEDRLDLQIENLEQQLRIVKGLEEPLTRQAELENRILELQARRVSMTDRIRFGIKGIVNELGNAAIKAGVLNAVLNALGQGGGSGGFWGIFKTVLGIASTVPGPHQPFTAGASAASGFFGGSPGFPAGGPPGIRPDMGGPPGVRPGFGGPPGIQAPSWKPAGVNIINPTFVGSDAVSMVEEATTLAGRRVFNG